MKANNKKQTTPEDRLLKAIFKADARSNAGAVDKDLSESEIIESRKRTEEIKEKLTKELSQNDK